jgi:hypothetical protein
MKKLCTLLVALTIYNINSRAQDIIVLNNSRADEIQAKIMEGNDDNVKYKIWTYQEGPTFSISTENIFIIKYQNGEKQTFTTVESTFNDSYSSIKRVDPNKVIKYPKFAKDATNYGAKFSYYIPDDIGTDMFVMAVDIWGGYYFANYAFINAGLGFMYSCMSDIEYESYNIRLPFNIGYTFPIDNDISVDIGTGPVLNYAVAGENFGTKFKDMNNIKRFSAQWKFGAELTILHVGIGFEYLLGMGKSTNGCFGLSINIKY